MIAVPGVLPAFMHGMRRITPWSSPPTQQPVTALNFLANPSVAGTIALETWRVGRIRGIQFTGTVTEPAGDDLIRARKIYLRRFPYAALAEVHLWVIGLDYIKLTDNRLGFGKKIIWSA